MNPITYTAADLDYQKRNDSSNPHLKQYIDVPGLGGGKVTVKFNSNGSITDLDIIERMYESANLVLEKHNDVRPSNSQEKCHKMPVCYIKMQTKSEVVNKNLFMLNENAIKCRDMILKRHNGNFPFLEDPVAEPEIDTTKEPASQKFGPLQGFMDAYSKKSRAKTELEKRTNDIYARLYVEEQFGFFFPLQDSKKLNELTTSKNIKELCIQTTKAVATLYFNRDNVLSNLFAGDKDDNQFSSAMGFILKPYVHQWGNYPKNYPYTISFDTVPRYVTDNRVRESYTKINKIIKGDQKKFQEIYKNSITINNRDELLNLFFLYNYSGGDLKRYLPIASNDERIKLEHLKRLFFIPFIGDIGDPKLKSHDDHIEKKQKVE